MFYVKVQMELIIFLPIANIDVGSLITPSLRGRSVDFAQKKTCYTPLLSASRANFNHVMVEMIGRPKLEGSQSLATVGQALRTILAVTKGSNPLSSLRKQKGGLAHGAQRPAALQFRPSYHFNTYIFEINSKSS